MYNLKIKIQKVLLEEYNIANYTVWLWNMISYIKGGMQAKGIWMLPN